MAGSMLRSFVSGTRQVLSAQLFVSIGAVALAGWTLGVTNELIRERDRLRERVIQLEEDMGSRGIVVPETPTVVDTAPPPAEDVYPGEVGLDDETAPEQAPEQREPQAGGADVEPGQTRPTPPRADDRSFNPGQIFSELFTPAPPMRTVVLHVRNDNDAAYARRLGDQLAASAQVRVIIHVLSPRTQQQSGYAYFDGRQSQAAARLVAAFNDIARENQIAPWSAQLRGTALPAQGEYTADRLDIVLPPLTQNPTLRIDPRALEMRRVDPQPQQTTPPIR